MLVLIALQFIGAFENKLGWKRYPMIYEVRADVGSKLSKEIVGTERAEALASAVNAARHRMFTAILSVPRFGQPAARRAGQRQRSRSRAHLLPRSPRPGKSMSASCMNCARVMRPIRWSSSVTRRKSEPHRLRKGQRLWQRLPHHRRAPGPKAGTPRLRANFVRAIQALARTALNFLTGVPTARSSSASSTPMAAKPS